MTLPPIVPPVGTRFAFRYGRTESRVYELVSSVSSREARAAGQHGCDRHTLRLVEEKGFPPEHTAGVGFEIHVEDAWFLTHRSGPAFAPIVKNEPGWVSLANKV